MRIYVLGGSGVLGQVLIKQLSQHVIAAPGVSEPRIDVGDYVALCQSILQFAPDAIVNLAALIGLENCAQHSAEALRVNALGAANVALIASELDISLLYLSTSSVLNPTSVYGKTKLMGEQVTRSLAKHFIVRAARFFGSLTEGATGLNKVLHRIKAGEEVSVVGDAQVSLTYIPDLCVAIETILQSGRYGTYHVACEGETTLYDVAAKFASQLGNGARVHRVDAAFFAKDYSVVRPSREILMNTSIAGFQSRHWTKCLEEMQ
jgi:dTDP-4-dehydrorhamnose reductase